jgi:hypothetical protein
MHCNDFIARFALSCKPYKMRACYIVWSRKKRADIVIFDKLNPSAIYIIIELKKPKLKEGKE